MKRNTKLIYQLLEYVEREHNNGPVMVPDVEAYSDVVVHYHVGLCVEAGYLAAAEPRELNGCRTFDRIHRLTWNGHEEIERVRNSYASPNLALPPPLT